MGAVQPRDSSDRVVTDGIPGGCRAGCKREVGEKPSLDPASAEFPP
jgi:hypothetical protein